jgi:hypothetical protein
MINLVKAPRVELWLNTEAGLLMEAQLHGTKLAGLIGKTVKVESHEMDTVVVDGKWYVIVGAAEGLLLIELILEPVKQMTVVLYSIEGKDVVGGQTKEEVLQRIQYGEIVSEVDLYFNVEGFKKWCAAQGTIIEVKKWEGLPGLAMWIEDEDGMGYDVDGNLLEGGKDNV